MPRLSVWTIRAALVALGIGFLFGALMLANKGVPFDPSLWRLLPAHIELVLLGWTMQLALGVAFGFCHVSAAGGAATSRWRGPASRCSTQA